MVTVFGPGTAGLQSLPLVWMGSHGHLEAEVGEWGKDVLSSGVKRPGFRSQSWVTCCVTKMAALSPQATSSPV